MPALSALNPRSSHRRRVTISAIILVALLAIGSLGFWLLGTHHNLFECMYVTTVILTTVGMKEDSFNLNPAEQAWAMFLMLAGISAALYATTNLVAFMVEGEIVRLFGRRHVEHKISKLSGHFIICGFGRMGRALCETLRGKGRAFVLIESDMEKLADAEALGYLCIKGDAMTEESLSCARVESAAGLATCLRSDADNVFVTLTARGMSPSLLIIARAEERATDAKLRRAGANKVICPPVLGAGKIAQMLLTPAVDELMEMAVAGPDIEVSKMRLDELPGAIGQSIRQLDLRGKGGLTIVAVVREDGSRTFTPPPELVLRTGDEIILAGPPGNVFQLTKWYGSTKSAATPSPSASG